MNSSRTKSLRRGRDNDDVDFPNRQSNMEALNSY